MPGNEIMLTSKCVMLIWHVFFLPVTLFDDSQARCYTIFSNKGASLHVCQFGCANIFGFLLCVFQEFVPETWNERRNGRIRPHSDGLTLGVTKTQNCCKGQIGVPSEPAGRKLIRHFSEMKRMWNSLSVYYYIFFFPLRRLYIQSSILIMMGREGTGRLSSISTAIFPVHAIPEWRARIEGCCCCWSDPAEVRTHNLLIEKPDTQPQCYPVGKKVTM